MKATEHYYPPTDTNKAGLLVLRKLQEMRRTGYFKVKVDTRYHKKGDVVFVTTYRNHNGGQYILDSGHWFSFGELEPCDRNGNITA